MIVIPLSNASQRPIAFPTVTVFIIATNAVVFSARTLEPRGLRYVDPTSTVPNLGASGAIAAVMDAFLVTHPHDRISFLACDFCAHPRCLYPGSTPDWSLGFDAALQSRRSHAASNRGSGLRGSCGRLHLWCCHCATVHAPAGGLRSVSHCRPVFMSKVEAVERNKSYNVTINYKGLKRRRQ